MIVGLRDERLRAFYVEDSHSRSVPSDIESRLFRKRQMMDDAATALILGRVLGNSPEFRLNTQRRTDIRAVLNCPEERARVDRAKPSAEAAHDRLVEWPASVGTDGFAALLPRSGEDGGAPCRDRQAWGSSLSTVAAGTPARLLDRR